MRVIPRSLYGRLLASAGLFIVIALVVAGPTVLGLLTIMLSGRRWITALGALLLAVGPGWFGALVAIQVASGG